ncbi:hypothetical protein BHM03_00039078 [Ensete ventricosum]|nr:hypothetical protein BHM03_00039078 [Ensete ventricosum]
MISSRFRPFAFPSFHRKTPPSFGDAAAVSSAFPRKKGQSGYAGVAEAWAWLLAIQLSSSFPPFPDVSYVGEDNASESSGRRKYVILQKKGKWKAISKVMAERGCYVSRQQCEDKFNDLNKRYKKLMDILGRRTTCRVVENPALLGHMSNLPEKMKDDVWKILSSKHLSMRRCAPIMIRGRAMGACASKPMAQGDAPPPLEQLPPPAQNPKVVHSPKEEEEKEEEAVVVAAAAEQEVEHEVPDESHQKSLDDQFKKEENSESIETEKNIVLETVAPDTVEAKEEVIEHKVVEGAVPHDEAVSHEIDVIEHKAVDGAVPHDEAVSHETDVIEHKAVDGAVVPHDEAVSHETDVIEHNAVDEAVPLEIEEVIEHKATDEAAPLEKEAIEHKATDEAAPLEKEVIEHKATDEALPHETEVIEHKITDKAVPHETEEQPTKVSNTEADEAISNATPQETSVPSLATNTEVSGANAEPVKPEVIAPVKTDKAESAESNSQESPAAQEKKGDVFHALFTAYNNLLNKS